MQRGLPIRPSCRNEPTLPRFPVPSRVPPTPSAYVFSHAKCLVLRARRSPPKRSPRRKVTRYSLAATQPEVTRSRISAESLGREKRRSRSYRPADRVVGVGHNGDVKRRPRSVPECLSCVQLCGIKGVSLPAESRHLHAAKAADRPLVLGLVRVPVRIELPCTTCLYEHSCDALVNYASPGRPLHRKFRTGALK